MPCKRLQPSYRSSANSLTLVPTGTTKYIAAGDSQAAVPFPPGIGRDFDLQWKTASGLSYLLLQLVVTAGKRAFQRRALRRPHPARREVTCGDTDMAWPRLGAVLHTTGLWGRSYLGVGRGAASRTWQKLCHREDTGLPWGKIYRGRIHIWDYPKGNQAIRTPSPVQGLTGDLGELTPVLGLASDCSAQSDCRGCLEDSTRVHRPGNWTGGQKRHSYPRVRGNGAASVTPASSSRPLLTQHTGRNWLLGAPRPVERQGPSRGWGSSDTAGWYPLAVYRGAMPTSGPGSVASAEVVSYEAIRAAWLQLRMSYAPGASETVSVVPHSCLCRNSGSSALLGHVPPCGVPSYSPSLTPHREKRFSAQGRACSFPSWPEAPTGWGAGTPSPWDRPTALWIGLG